MKPKKKLDFIFARASSSNFKPVLKKINSKPILWYIYKKENVNFEIKKTLLL